MIRSIAVRIGLSLLLMKETAAADPSFHVTVEGNCPTGAELARALAAKGNRIEAPGSPAEYAVGARAESAGALLQLTHRSRGRVIERRLSSDDCRALAEAMAVVVEAYFVEVGEVPRPGQPLGEVAPPVATTNEASEVAAGPAGPAALVSTSTAAVSTPSTPHAKTPDASRNGPGTNRAPATPQPTKNGARLAAPVAVTAQQWGATAKPLGATAALSRRLLPRFFLGVGPVLDLPQGNATAAVEAGAGADWRELPLFFDFAAGTSLPATVGSNPDRVWRWTSQALVRTGIPFGKRFGYRPWVGIGVAVTRLRAEDLAVNPTRTTVAPILGAGFELAWPLSRWWQARGVVGCRLYPISDRYDVDNKDEIGQGPRATCTTAIGMGWGGLSVDE